MSHTPTKLATDLLLLHQSSKSVEASINEIWADIASLDDFWETFRQWEAKSHYQRQKWTPEVDEAYHEYKDVEKLLDVAGRRVRRYNKVTGKSDDTDEILMRARLAIYQAKTAVRYD